jgi:NAD-dependent deacetylase
MMGEPGDRELISRLAAAQHPVVFSGAGLSAESGIPTFRGRSDHALWSRYDPQQLASIDGFTSTPDLVLEWYAWRRGLVIDARPNSAHDALARWLKATLITQNVDDLQERAGALPDRVLHLHGSIMQDRCHAGCGWSKPVDPASPADWDPCPDCGARTRPGVVWFGEGLPEDTWALANRICSKADLILVVGTSGVVQPAASLVELAAAAGAYVVNVNPEVTPLDSISDVCLHVAATEVLPGLLPD